MNGLKRFGAAELEPAKVATSAPDFTTGAEALLATRLE
jgi:hypothetical protein